MDQFAATQELDRDSEAGTVWRTALDRIAQFASAGFHTDVYQRGFAWIYEGRGHIPDLTTLNTWLAPTGWQTAYTDGYVPVEIYKELHQRRVFPISRHVRRLRDLEHSAAPDLLHDVVGHLPMLFAPAYSNLLQLWGERASDCEPSAEDVAVAKALSLLIAAEEQDVVRPEEVVARTADLAYAHEAATQRPSRNSRFESFYTWAIEYGVLQTPEGLRVTGAAILSSCGELQRIADGKVRMIPFGADALSAAVNYTVAQDRMFLARDFQEYFDVLGSI